MKKMTVVLDVDDVLAVCMPEAIRLWNESTGATLTMRDITGWASDDAGWVKYFSDADFVANQPVNPGAKHFVAELLRRDCDVVITTAVPMCVANARAQWVRENFPGIQPKNIMIGTRKDLIAADVMVDDAPHNILSSKARYPILMRKPWNQNVTGMMSVNDFDELLRLVDTIMRKNGYAKSAYPADVICLVGPSGSGKHDVIKALREVGYVVPQILTTNQKASQDYYRVISKEEFEFEKDMHHFAETTSYAGNYYGIRMEEMVSHMSKRYQYGVKLVVPIDVCGANALQRHYGECVKTVYLKRSRSELVSAILQKNLPDSEKALRILALDAELKNEGLCDYSFSGDIDDIVHQIKAM